MIEIRRLTNADVDDYRAIRLEALRGDPIAFGSTYEAEVERPRSHFEQRLAATAVFAAYADARIVGMAGFMREGGLKDRHKGFLWGMYVGPEARGLGVGRTLVQAVLDHATEVVEQIILAVTQGNEAAIALYESLGFTVYGVEPRALKSGDRYWDDVLMVKFLRRPDL